MKVVFAVARYALVLVAVYFVFMAPWEMYCVLWPGIDTKYASGYSERRFRRVETGMSKDKVAELLGDPLYKHEVSRSHPAYDRRSGDEVWSYTSDGAAPWGDWAWLARTVMFRDGHVVQRISQTYYN